MYRCIENAEIKKQEAIEEEIVINDDPDFIGDILKNWDIEKLKEIKESIEAKSTEKKTFAYYSRRVNNHFEVGIAEVKFIQ